MKVQIWLIMHSVGKRPLQHMRPLRFENGKKITFPTQIAAKKMAVHYSRIVSNLYYRVTPHAIEVRQNR